MPRMKEVDVDIMNDDVLSVVSEGDSSGTSITLDGTDVTSGVWTAPDGLGHILEITDAGGDIQTDVTFTIAGTDENGNTITDAITGPGSSATVVSTKFFKTVTGITVSAAQGGTETIDVGTANTTSSASSRIIPLNHRSSTAAQVAVDVTGTINFDVQETFDEVLGDASTARVFYDVTALAAKTADTNSQISVGATGVRLVVNSYTDGAEAQMRIIQPDNS